MNGWLQVITGVEFNCTGSTRFTSHLTNTAAAERMND